MELTKKQEEGIRIIKERYDNGEKYVVISGYAGVGKSTLVKVATESLGIEKSKVAYATFTGKAAEVLRRKGNEGAITLHKLLYDYIRGSDGNFIKTPKVDIDYSIVVIDEVSMAPQSMINLLLTHPIFAIFLGDPFQIPPIDKEDKNNLLDNPHIFLDEVMRQAAESEIIRLTMDIRNHKMVPYSKGNEVMVIPKRELSTSMLLWADQIICSTNKTRRELNNIVRSAKGFSGPPQNGEKLICRRNYWDECSSCGDALVNGTTGICSEIQETKNIVPRKIKYYPGSRTIEAFSCKFEATEDSVFDKVIFDKSYIANETKTLTNKQSYMLGNFGMSYLEPLEFEFGYAITGHRAQGSQWKKVLVFEESFPYDTEEHARWLYTCCTRPEEKLVLVR